MKNNTISANVSITTHSKNEPNINLKKIDKSKNLIKSNDI
jgi:hypothetical protein